MGRVDIDTRVKRGKGGKKKGQKDGRSAIKDINRPTSRRITKKTRGEEN